MKTATVNSIEALFELIAMSSKKNVLPRLSASVKKAILALALNRYNANKEMICAVLGLSRSQFDDEILSADLAQLASKGRPIPSLKVTSL